MNPISEKIPAVLIIDDEKENRIRLEGLLLVLGFKTYAAEDSEEGLKIYNPAFDTIARQYISGYVCEFGIVPPQSVFYVFNDKYSKFARQWF